MKIKTALVIILKIKEEKDFLLKNKWKDLKLIELEEEKDFYLKK